jgi:regulator of sirC expression with transglutaminase-like and TPR domain
MAVLSLPGFERAEKAMKEGRSEDALRIADGMVRLHPDRPEGYWVRGLVRLRFGQRAEAVEDLKLALTRMDAKDERRESLEKSIKILELSKPRP